MAGCRHVQRRVLPIVRRQRDQHAKTGESQQDGTDFRHARRQQRLHQAGLARGLFDLATLNRIHARMHDMVQRQGGRIEAVFFCPHRSQDNCACRKPKPGMLLEAADRFGADFSGQAFVGDSLRDLQAASAAHMQPVLVRTGNGMQTLEQASLIPDGTQVYDDLMAFAETLL